MAALGMALTFALPSAAHAQIITPPLVPTGLEVDAPNEAFLLGRGVGTQNYICQPAASLGRVAWTLFTPQATLFSDEREQLITHFSSPNPDEGGVVRHVGAFPRYEHRLGAGDSAGHGQVDRDSLGQVASGWSARRTERRRYAIWNDIHPTAE